MRNLRPWLLAFCAALLLWSWQALNVHGYYGGDWTAPALTGDQYPLPPNFPAHTKVYSDFYGYDGQFYRRIAFDPFLQHGYYKNMDDAVYRYRRILLPALAWAFALGDPAYIDRAYYFTILLAVFLATAFAALWLPTLNISANWALLVPILPGVLSCANRLTVDAAFYAAIPAAFLAAHRGRWPLCWLALAAAALSRELGLMLIAAFVLHALINRRWPLALGLASAALPFLAWHFFVLQIIPSGPGRPVVPAWLTRRLPVVTQIDALLHPFDYPFPPLFRIATQILDYAMLLGAAIAASLSLYRLRNWQLQILDIFLALYAILYLFTGNRYFWADTHSAARTFTPFAALFALSPAHGPLFWRIFPLAAFSLRIFWELSSITLQSLSALL